MVSSYFAAAISVVDSVVVGAVLAVALAAVVSDAAQSSAAPGVEADCAVGDVVA